MTTAILYGQEQTINTLKKDLPGINDSARYVDALNRISMLSYEENPDTTFHYANKARDIARRIDYPAGIADANNNLGIYFDTHGNTDLGLRYYSDAYNQYTRLSDTSNMIQTLMNIAMLYSTNGNDDKAISRYKEALALGASLSHDSIIALVIYNYILQYPRQFSPDSIDLYINKAVRIAEKYHDSTMLLAIGQLQANRLLQSGRRDTAIHLLQQSAARSLDQKFFYMSLDILVELGDIYSPTDSAKAVGYYQHALNIATQQKYMSYELDLNNKLFDFYSKKKDRTKMFEYSSALVQLYKDKQQLDNQSGIDYITYALKDDQLQSIQERAGYGQRLLWLESIAFLLLIVICLLLWRNTQQSRRTHATLQEQYQKLANTTAALETSNKNYAHLIRVVAHDLRNPIGAISSITDALVRESDKDKGWVRLINDASKRCMQMITELLTTDFDINKGALHKEPVDLNALLEQTTMLLAYRANEKQQQLITGDTSLPVIQADKEKLARVLDNLVVNAIKFSPEHAEIHIMADATPTSILISVEDNGVGIPPELHDHLFEPFVGSVKRKGTAGEQSFGLGLYICRQIIEAHGGRIWFESKPGKGSTFYLSIPIWS